MSGKKTKNRYEAIIEKIFFDKYRPGTTEIRFARSEIIDAAKDLGIRRPKNIGDVLYSVRYRNQLPESILKTQPNGKEWIILGVERSVYSFRLVPLNRVVPRTDMLTIRVPDSTPEIISSYALNDEQALLAKLRYNRLLDIFLGIANYSLQNHLRTTLSNGTQIEIDELYIGLDRYGCHYIVPVQAKGGKDQISAVQTMQDIQWCVERYEKLKCRAISAQFMEGDVIALFELTIENDAAKVVDERHYKLVPADDLDPDQICSYR